jgi:hypothetical protein
MPYVQLLLPPEVTDVAGAYLVCIPHGSVRPTDDNSIPGYWPATKMMRVPASSVYYSLQTRHFYLFTGQTSGVEEDAYQSGYYTEAAGPRVVIAEYTVAPMSGSSLTCRSPLGLLTDNNLNFQSMARVADLQIINPALMEELSGFLLDHSNETNFANPELRPYLRYLSAWALRKRLGRSLAACPFDLSFYMESQKTPDRFWQVTIPRVTYNQQLWSVLRGAGECTTTSGKVSQPHAHKVTPKLYTTRLSMGNNLRTQIINKSKTYNFVQVPGLRRLELPWGHQMLKSLPTKNRSLIRPKDLCKEE